MKRLIFVMIAAAFVLAACSSDESGTGTFHCSFEESKTSGCGGSSFGPFIAGCSTVDFELREGLTRESFCAQAYPASDIECAGGCCVQFRFQNVVAGDGPCP